MENNKLFITNLNFNTPLQKLVDLCASIGSVKDSYRPEGKGFAFITMHTGADAQRVIDELSGTLLDGRPLKIEVSVPKDQRPARPMDSRPAFTPGTSRPPDTGRFVPGPGAPPPAPRKDDKKKGAYKGKDDDFNKGPAKPTKAKLPEKTKGGANRNRWMDDLDEDDIEEDLDLILDSNDSDDDTQLDSLD